MKMDMKIFFAAKGYGEEWERLWKNRRFVKMLADDGIIFTVHVFHYVNYKNSGLEVINLN